MKKHLNGRYKLNGIYYYLKKCEIDEIYKEIIVSNLASLINLNCAKYELFVKDNILYSKSEDLNYQGSFILASKWSNLYKKKYIPLNDILKLAYIYFDNKVIEDIIKMYIFDIIIQNYDRHDDNFGFIKNGKCYSLVILDNAFSFDSAFFPYILFKDNVIYNGDILKENSEKISDYYAFEMTNELNYFKENMPQKYWDIICYVLETISPNFIENKFKELISFYNREVTQLENFDMQNMYHRKLSENILGK